jgi:hypothetical protein
MMRNNMWLGKKSSSSPKSAKKWFEKSPVGTTTCLPIKRDIYLFLQVLTETESPIEMVIKSSPKIIGPE